MQQPFPQSTWRSRLDRWIHHPAVEWGLILLILISVVLVIVEVSLGHREQGDDLSDLQSRLRLVSDGITLIFGVEMLIRYLATSPKRRFFRHYWIDLIAILPFWRALRILRLLRLLRLIRVGILLNRSLNRASPSLATGINLQIGIFLSLGLVILGGALMIYQIEGGENQAFRSLADALWWSFFTLIAGEPIGGEPTTEVGRLVTLMMMLSGLTMFAVLTGIVSAVMIDQLRLVMDGRYLELDELQNHIVIGGWNRGGHLIVQELQQDTQLRRLPIVIVAEFTEVPQQELKEVDRSQLYFYVGDYTHLDVLEQVGIRSASQAILLADATHPRSDQDRDARTVLAALTIEKLNPKIHTCAQLLDRRNNVQLRVAGVEDVVVGDEVTSHLIATSARNQGLTEILMELLTLKVGNQFYKIPLPSAWVGIHFAEASQRTKHDYDGILLAIERHVNGKRDSLVNPPQDTILQLEDYLIVVARHPPKHDAQATWIK